MSTHEHHMHRALALAERAAGRVSPNPLVGCVIVQGDTVVAEGWHRGVGLAHAEAEALAIAGEKARGSTLYATLEPCNHHGRTPPCTDAIMAAGVSRVVYAVADPDPVAAGGADRLRDAGIEVIQGICEAEARHANRFFLHAVTRGRPWVIAKFAASLDGRTATHAGHSQWITGADARLASHRLRQQVDAIAVGADTVIADDPELTVRLPESELAAADVRHPLRIVFDSRGRVPLTHRIFDVTRAETLVTTTDAMPTAHQQALVSKGVRVCRLPAQGAADRVDPAALLDWLGARSYRSLLVEGGAGLHGSFQDAGLIDEVWAFLAPFLIGGQAAHPSIGGVGIERLDQAMRLQDLHTQTIGEDLLVRGIVRHPATQSVTPTAVQPREAS